MTTYRSIVPSLDQLARDFTLHTPPDWAVIIASPQNPHPVLWARVGIAAQTAHDEMEHQKRQKFLNYRYLDMRHVAKMTRSMNLQEWVAYLGEPIMFAHDGHLLNGWNRLKAIAESGSRVEMIVLWNVPPELVKHMDGGMVRALRDHLRNYVHTRGMDPLSNKDASDMAASLKWMRYISGVSNDIAPIPTSFPVIGQEDFESLLLTLADMDTVSRGYLHARNLRSSIHGERSVRIGPVAAAYWWISKHADDPKAVDSFFSAISTASNLQPASPELVLRETLTSRFTLKGMFLPVGGKTQKVSETWICGMIIISLIKAWNAWVRRQSMSFISFANGNEHFPTPLSGRSRP